jgi:hypothetical protein
MRSSRVYRLSTVVSVLLVGPLLGSTPARSGPPAPPARQQLDERQLSNDLRLRHDYRLTADETYIRDLYASAHAGSAQTATRHGALLTPEEDAAVAETNSAIFRIGRVVSSYVKEQDAHLGGVYVDREFAGRLVVAFTEDVERHREELTRRVAAIDTSPRAEVAIVRVHYSLDALYALQKRIEDDVDAGTRLVGVDVTSVAVSETDNHVVIGVASDPRDAQGVVNNSYPGLPVVVEEMTRPAFHGIDGTDSPPFRGGQRINALSPGGMRIGMCTSAFVAYKLIRTDAAIFTRNYYLLTAGHCEADPKTGRGQYNSVLWTQDKTYIGRSDLSVFASPTSADALRIPISPAVKSWEVALEYPNHAQVLCEQANGDGRENQYEVMSGATSGILRAGKLRMKSVTTYTTFPGGARVKLVNQREADYYSQSGDSGGTVYGDYGCPFEAHGIHSSFGQRRTRGRLTNAAIYTPISSAIVALGLTGVVTPTT